MIIVEDMKLRKICAKRVTRLLNDEQNKRCEQVYQNILKELETEPDMSSRE